ncbi:hypothetical protein M413DRAFT_197136 [Hebeloma cylindrosporum]|uniref:Uncharacterized protein n=1 Tax=Hebeloma cylindrosporum TaxID=76867 RepID=A0A0C3C4X5_HEBCY|nr:hypothetical protein M413DRAFT_197136 [Hebeloma cylindrosporum h7]
MPAFLNSPQTTHRFWAPWMFGLTSVRSFTPTSAVHRFGNRFIAAIIRFLRNCYHRASRQIPLFAPSVTGPVPTQSHAIFMPF